MFALQVTFLCYNIDFKIRGGWDYRIGHRVKISYYFYVLRIRKLLSYGLKKIVKEFNHGAYSRQLRVS